MIILIQFIRYILQSYYQISKNPFGIMFTIGYMIKIGITFFDSCHFLIIVYFSFYSNKLNILPYAFSNISIKYLLMNLLVLFYIFACFQTLDLLAFNFSTWFSNKLLLQHYFLWTASRKKFSCFFNCFS